MAGHSKFKNIMHRKSAQDKNRAKVFTKLIRELTVAATLSPDPGANPRLRTALSAARASNMPKDTVERAVNKGSGGDDGVEYCAMRYEGYGPGGVAVIVETLTDNKNRTAAEIRSIFGKMGGNMGAINSVSFQFDYLGCITYPCTMTDHDTLFEIAAESGADDLEETEESYDIYYAADQLHHAREALSKRLGDPSSAQLTWKPKILMPVTNKGHAKTLLKLIEALGDNDDVQSVVANFDMDARFMNELL